MPKQKNRIPKPDSALKDFFANNDNFADLFNATIFGAEVLRSDDLKRVDSSYTESVRLSGKVSTVVRNRDLIRMSSMGAKFVILGIEDQDKIHYAMPIRKMLMDSLGYLAECKELGATQGTETWTADEYLSRIGKDMRLTPILTVVFYTGEKKWDGPRSVHEMLDIDDRLRPFVPDYPLYVIDIGHDSYSFAGKELNELQKILHLIYTGEANDSHELFSKSMVALAGILTGSYQMYVGVEDGEGDVVMSTYLQKMFDEAEEKGIEKGIEKGEARTLYSLVSKGIITPEVGAGEMKVDLDTFNKGLFGYKKKEQI